MTVPPNQPSSGRAQSQTLVVLNAETAPSHGLYQPYFPLTEADFLRLQGANSVWVGLGGSVLAFAVTYGLPLFVTQLQTGVKMHASDWWITGGGIIVGIVLLVVGRFLSAKRRNVLREIEKHFRENPGRQEFRIGGTDA